MSDCFCFTSYVASLSTMDSTYTLVSISHESCEPAFSYHFFFCFWFVVSVIYKNGFVFPTKSTYIDRAKTLDQKNTHKKESACIENRLQAYDILFSFYYKEWQINFSESTYLFFTNGALRHSSKSLPISFLPERYRKRKPWLCLSISLLTSSVKGERDELAVQLRVKQTNDKNPTQNLTELQPVVHLFLSSFLPFIGKGACLFRQDWCLANLFTVSLGIIWLIRRCSTMMTLGRRWFVTMTSWLRMVCHDDLLSRRWSSLSW